MAAFRYFLIIPPKYNVWINRKLKFEVGNVNLNIGPLIAKLSISFPV